MEQRRMMLGILYKYIMNGRVMMKKAKSVKKAKSKKKTTPRRKTAKPKAALKKVKKAVKKITKKKAVKKIIQKKKVLKPAKGKPVAVKSPKSTTPMTDLILERMRIIDGRNK
jgi:hypothetical protein